MKPSNPRKIEWIPSNYVFGTASLKLKGIIKKKKHIIHQEKLHPNHKSHQKSSIHLPTIEIINRNLVPKNNTRVNLAEFLKRKDKKYYTVFHSIISEPVNVPLSKICLKKV